MDDRRFDALTRSLASAQSRRGLLKALAGGLVAALGSEAASTQEAEPCPPKRVCGGGCCPAASRCVKGQCVARSPAGCPAGQGRCNDVCIDLTTTANCGSCGNACPASTDPCLAPACLNGVCGFVPGNEGGFCNDGNACTQTDFCQGGVCVGTNPIVCAALDECHVPGVCDTATGLCSNPDADDGTLCGTNNACITSTCSSGVCNAVHRNCDDGIACTTNGCDTVTGCTQTVDPGFCLIDGQCYADGVRNSDNPCQACIPGDRNGAWTNLPANTSCADTDRCDGDEACDGEGNCLPGIPVSCPPPNQCQWSVTCNTETGACEYLNKGNGFPCNDGDLCTEGTPARTGSAPLALACNATRSSSAIGCYPAIRRSAAATTSLPTRARSAVWARPAPAQPSGARMARVSRSTLARMA